MIRATALFVLASVAALGRAPAAEGRQEGIPEGLLKKLKDATVYIKVDEGSGSGFLARDDGSAGYVVTNHHVASGRLGEKVQVVFFAGSSEEREVLGTIAASDPRHDLAILKVESKGLPKAIDCKAGPELKGEAPLVILGFPWGADLAVGKKSPIVTVTYGKVARDKLDIHRGQAHVQIEGEVNPGSSGGPVLDRSGALVGVTVAKLMGTNTGFLVPAEYVADLFRDLGGARDVGLKEGGAIPVKPEGPVVGKAEVTGTPLEEGRDVVAGAPVARLKIDAEGVTPPVLWSADGKWLYVLEGGLGRLSKISVPGFREERRLTIGAACAGMSLSKEGLVVLVTGAGQVWGVEERTLGVTAKIKVSGGWSVAATPAAGLAYIDCGETMVVLDLERKIEARRISAKTVDGEQGFRARRHRTAGKLVSWHRSVVTPDGRFLFCLSDGGLHRFRISGTDLEYLEAGPPVGDDNPRIIVSSDSKYVALLSSRAGAVAAGSGPGRGTCIYAVGDLQTPALQLRVFTRAFGYDATTGAIYGEDGEAPLIAFSALGAVRRVFPLFESAKDGPAQILVHPDGKRALVLGPGAAVWVELPE